MKKGRVLIASSVILIILSFLPLHLALPRLSETTGQYDLGPRGVNGPTLYFFYGTTATLDVTVSEANRDVYFYITDAVGNRVSDAGRIYNGYHLEWTSDRFGAFTFNFDNTMSWFSHKNVNWSVSMFPYKTIFLISGIALLIVGVWRIMSEEKVVSRLRLHFFKKPEPNTLECAYCGTFYSKTLDKCPNCGARKKIGKSE